MTSPSSPLYWSDEDGDVNAPAPSSPEVLASRWLAQVDAFDGLPPTRWPKKRITFSPSKADACLRELYYDFVNAEPDAGNVTPWKERRRHNGDAYHAETQKRYQHEMVEALRKANLPVDFEIIACEVPGERTWIVDGVRVAVKGRVDILARYVGESIPGLIETGDVLVVDLKAKHALSGVNKIRRFGVPDYGKAQMNGYSLIKMVVDGVEYKDLRVAILHYESLQKMGENEVESKDVYPVAVVTTDDDQRNILVRWASVVKAVEEKRVPKAEPSKCYFCAYKATCAKEGDAS